MKIYRVSGLRSAGTASVVARAISGLQRDISVKIYVEEGLVAVKGRVSEAKIADAVKDSGCEYLGQLGSDTPEGL